MSAGNRKKGMCSLMMCGGLEIYQLFDTPTSIVFDLITYKSAALRRCPVQQPAAGKL